MMHESRMDLLLQLDALYTSAVIKLYRLARKAEKRGLSELAYNIREEVYTIQGDRAYGRFTEDYTYAEMFLE